MNNGMIGAVVGDIAGSRFGTVRGTVGRDRRLSHEGGASGRYIQ